MAQTGTKVLTAHVPLPLAEKVDQMAERLERSRGWIMKQALSAWLDQEEERERLTREALSDLARLFEFLAPVNKPAAARAVQALTKAPTILLTNPRIGEQLFEFEPREVRRLLVGHYEMRYEIQESTIYMLRLWHTREDR